MRITVVVPFRNEHRHIERCLTALTRQEPFPGEYEVVAVADVSTDGSASIVRGFRSVRLIRSSDAGPYAARNAGVAEADGDVVAFTDADCEPAPDWLRALAAAFERREVAAVVGPRAPACESFAVGLLAAYEEAKEDYIFGGHRAGLYFGATSNLALRRSALSDVGGFPERRRGADTLVVRRLVARLGPDAVAYAPTARVRHLEIEGVHDYYRKAFVYARSLQRLDGGSRGRILRTAERLDIWRSVRSRGGHTVASSAALLALLIGGAACWEAGRRTAAFPPLGS